MCAQLKHWRLTLRCHFSTDFLTCPKCERLPIRGLAHLGRLLLTSPRSSAQANPERSSELELASYNLQSVFRDFVQTQTVVSQLSQKEEPEERQDL